MFGIGTTELLIILVIVLVLFGSSRLPELGKGLGKGLRSFKDAITGKDGGSASSKKDESSGPPKA
jgi:sec-independent protein translocase protein TatA